MEAEQEGRFLLSGATMSDALGLDVKIAESVVLVYDAGLVPTRATKRRHQRSHHPFRQIGSLSDRVDIVVTPGPGAPVAAITIEFLANLGVRQLVAVGTAGLLLANEQPQSHYIISAAVSDEGTSAHYHDDLSASPALTSSLEAQLGGGMHTVVTTDVPFRHTPERLAKHRAGAALVEMECAAVFAAANHFGIAAAAVVIPSDHFLEDCWKMLPRPNHDETSEKLMGAAVSSLGDFATQSQP